MAAECPMPCQGTSSKKDAIHSSSCMSHPCHPECLCKCHGLLHHIVQMTGNGVDPPSLPKGDENAKKYQVGCTIWVHFHCRSCQRYFKRSEIPTRNCFKGSAHEKIKYFGRLFHLFNCLSKGEQSKGRAEKKRQTHGQTMQCSKFPTTKNCLLIPGEG